MGTEVTISLIITTYNTPRYLEACLRSVIGQSVMPLEIIVADDGSGDATKDVIDAFRLKVSVPVLHVWQQDDGFRLSEIRNKAIAAASGEYIIQLDGDTLMFGKHFIEDHGRVARRGCIFGGSRIMLSARRTEKILSLQGRVPTLFRFVDIRLFRFKVLTDRLAGRKSSRPQHIYGSNMAYWRDDAVAINGFNEDMTGWGYEDTDFLTRLANYGVRKHDIRHGGVQLHLYHKFADRSNELHNKSLMSHDVIRCENGIDNHIGGRDKE